MAVIGGREAEAGTVSLRRRGARDTESVDHAALIARLPAESESRAPWNRGA